MAFGGTRGYLFGLGKGSKAGLGSTYIDYQLLFFENGSIRTLSYSLEFVVGGVVQRVITLSPQSKLDWTGQRQNSETSKYRMILEIDEA